VTIQETFFHTKTVKALRPRSSGAVLQALEDFTGPDVPTRSQGLDRLLQLEAHLRSPLAAAVLGLRTLEPDLSLRCRVVAALACVLRPPPDGPRPMDEVRIWLRGSLAEMRQRQVFALLQVLAASPDQQDAVCTVLSACSFSGDALLMILSNRSAEPAVRVAAAKAIGRIGFLEAAPAMEAQLARIARRKSGQLAMVFAPGAEIEEEILLPAIQGALQALREAAD